MTASGCGLLTQQVRKVLSPVHVQTSGNDFIQTCKIIIGKSLYFS